MRTIGVGLLLTLTWAPLAAAQPARSPSSQDRLSRIPALQAAAERAAQATTPPVVAAPAPLVENLVGFDCGLSDLRWEGGNWVIRAGDVLVKELGNRPLEARDALRLIRELRLNQRGTVGSPQPVLEYWLSDGQAPTRNPTGMSLVPFDPDSLRIEQVQGHWCVRDAQRLLFAFGGHREQAEQALAVIKHYQFNSIGYLGYPIPEMMFLVAAARSPAPAGLSTPAGARPTSIRPGEFIVVQGTGRDALSQGTDSLRAPSNLPQRQSSDAKAQARLLLQSQVRQLDRAGLLTPEPGFLGDRVAFDWHQVQVRRQDRDWVLAAGSTVLANFGPYDNEARQAQRAVEYYRFTEQRRVGAPNPVFAYFLTNGQPPRGRFFGVPAVTFRPEGLSVRAFQGGYALCEDTRVILPLRGRAEDAEQILQIIQQEHFDALCQIGSTAPSPLAFFVRSR